jgi:sulfite exporter TauE/SafE
MNEAISLIGAVTAGLLGGVHCVGMCGGIVGALSIASPAAKPAARLPMLLSYNSGRLISYGVAGGLFGALGQLSLPLQQVQLMQSVLAVVAGLMMLLLGLYIGGWSRLLRHVEAVGGYFWRRIEPLGRNLLPVRNPLQGLLLGILWGWLPCGLVYSMLIWALASGSALNGALLLLAFGVGTLPNLLATGLLANRFVSFVQQPRMRTVAGLMLIAFGFYTLSRAAF